MKSTVTTTAATTLYHVRQSDQQCRRHALNMYAGFADIDSVAFSKYMDAFSDVYPYLAHPSAFDSTTSHHDNIVTYILRERYNVETVYIAPYALEQSLKTLGMSFDDVVDPRINAVFAFNKDHIWLHRRSAPADSSQQEWWTLDSLKPSASNTHAVSMKEIAGNGGGTGYIVPIGRHHAKRVAAAYKRFVEAYYSSHVAFQSVSSVVLSSHDKRTLEFFYDHVYDILYPDVQEPDAAMYLKNVAASPASGDRLQRYEMQCVSFLTSGANDNDVKTEVVAYPNVFRALQNCVICDLRNKKLFQYTETPMHRYFRLRSFVEASVDEATRVVENFYDQFQKQPGDLDFLATQVPIVAYFVFIL